MNKNILLLAAIGGAVFLVLQKQAQAAGMTTAQKQAAGLLNSPSQQKQVNVNGDMWTRLMGESWRNLTSVQNSDGSPAFLMKNIFGQVTTSDGKPIDSGDPMAAYNQALTGLPASGGTDYVSGLFPTLTSGLANLGWDEL